MKNIALIILTFFIVFDAVSQVPVAAIEFPEYNRLYRGYPNRVIPAVSNNDGAKVILQGTYVSIEKRENSDEYIVIPGPGRGRRPFYM